MEDTEKAWLAGLFDGEGCVWCRWPKRKNLIIEIKMTCKETLERVNELFPGRLVKGHLSKNAFGRKPQWKYSLDTNGSREFLETVFDFLVTKRNHAIAALAYCRSENDWERDNRAGLLKALNS